MLNMFIPGIIGLFLASCTNMQQKENRPNVILIMADDLGYGDVGYMGNTTVKTPNLDEMAASGVRFSQFYAAAPVCSPTRASCLTGRHPYRSGIPWAGRHALPSHEITLAEVMKANDYATALFGKWHIGGLSRIIDQSHFPNGPTPYSPPWEHGFDVTFASESMMPLYNPYYYVGGDFGTREYRHVQSQAVEYGQRTDGHPWKNLYWTGPGRFVDEYLMGVSDELLIDHALAFIRDQINKKKPFLTVIWFHTPHTPIVAGDDYRTMYPDLSIEAQHWFGCITAMDDQIGRLRTQLREWGIADETIVWFKSDNGPSYIHHYNSAGPLRGSKGELYEGGIRVPAILEWPAMFPKPKNIDVPASTSDLFPTLLSMTMVDHDSDLILDGEDIFPVLKGEQERNHPIGFLSPLPNRLQPVETTDDEQFAWINEQYKLISVDNGRTYQLYDLLNDISETRDVSDIYPEIKLSMKEQLLSWIDEVREEFLEVTGSYE